MRIGRHNNAAGKTQVVVLTADAGFEEQARLTFGASQQIALTRGLRHASKTPATSSPLDDATVVVIDLDAAVPGEMQALERLMARIGAWPPVVVVTQSFDESVARTLLQMRVADFMVKPVSPVELVRTCARVAKGNAAAAEATEAQIYTFLPAVGGAGVTTLAVQTAMMLLNSAASAASRRPAWSTSISSTAPAPTISISSRASISARSSRGPERLDRQLLEVMLSHHPSGLAVIAAPNRPAEMRSFDPDVVTRLLDMVSSQFRLCRVRHAAHLVLLDRQRAARLQQAVHRQRDDGAGPAPRQAAGRGDHASGWATGRKPQVIINRFEQKLFSSGLRKGRHRAGARRRLRRLHPEQLRPGARGDRPRRSARRGQARQQDHAAAQEADAAAAGGQAGAAERRQLKKFKLSWAR